MEVTKPECPLPNGAELRVYSYSLCPFAQRVRLVLAAKEIKYDLVEIDIHNNKPDWYKTVNPFGTTPGIIHKGSNIYESLVCCDYIEEVFPQNPLYNPDPLKRAYERIYIQYWGSKGNSAFFGVVKSKPLTSEISQKLIDAMVQMNTFLKQTGSGYFSGKDKPGMGDFMVWPWFERIPYLKDISGFDFEESSEKYPEIVAWMKLMAVNKASIEAKTDADALKNYKP